MKETQVGEADDNGPGVSKPETCSSLLVAC